MNLEKMMRQAWGTDEQYYKELEAFHERHKNATSIEYDNELNCPIRAVYTFTPLQVFYEIEMLKQKIREQVTKEAKDE